METVNREIILKRIGDNLCGVKQWSAKAEWAFEMSRYYSKAEALIELLEVIDCGFVGGFDEGQPRPQSLFDRWDWLYRKFHNPEVESFGCSLSTYEDLKKFKF